MPIGGVVFQRPRVKSGKSISERAGGVKGSGDGFPRGLPLVGARLPRVPRFRTLCCASSGTELGVRVSSVLLGWSWLFVCGGYGDRSFPCGRTPTHLFVDTPAVGQQSLGLDLRGKFLQSDPRQPDARRRGRVHGLARTGLAPRGSARLEGGRSVRPHGCFLLGWCSSLVDLRLSGDYLGPCSGKRSRALLRSNPTRDT